MCSKLNPICDIEKVAGSIGGKVAGSVFDQVAKAFADAAEQVTEWMWTAIAKTTTVDLTGSWFTSTLGITTTLAGLMITALFILELIKAVLRREPAALGRATVGIGGGLLGAAASIGLVTALLQASDALSDGVVKTAGLGGIGKLGGLIVPTAALSKLGSPALTLILGLGYVLASFFVWALFVIRKAMLYVAAVFAPVAFAGAPMRATSGWVRRWIEFTVALIFSKLAVVILFTLAISLVGRPGEGFAAVGSLFSGLAMLVIACFAPWLLFRLIHFVGGDIMAAHHHGITQATLHAGATPVTMATRTAMTVAGVVGTGTAITAASGGASPQLSSAAGTSSRSRENPAGIHTTTTAHSTGHPEIPRSSSPTQGAAQPQHPPSPSRPDDTGKKQQ